MKAEEHEEEVPYKRKIMMLNFPKKKILCVQSKHRVYSTRISFYPKDSLIYTHFWAFGFSAKKYYFHPSSTPLLVCILCMGETFDQTWWIYVFLWESVFQIWIKFFIEFSSGKFILHLKVFEIFENFLGCNYYWDFSWN